MSAFGGKADMTVCSAYVRFLTKADSLRALRDDARFCGDRCRQRNCRRRGDFG